jgi:hypothetical protein
MANFIVFDASVRIVNAKKQRSYDAELIKHSILSAGSVSLENN